MSSLEKQSNYHFQYTIGVNCEKEKAWKKLITVSDWSKWDTELKEATIFDDFKLGAKGELIPKSGPKLKFEISDYSEGEFYTFKTKMPIGYLVIKRELKFKEGQTYFTDDIQFTGFLKRFFGAMLGGGFKSVLPEVMQNFKNQLEKETSK
ncbi:MAG: SRPBCC family protein [Bacteroidota bacterium]